MARRAYRRLMAVVGGVTLAASLGLAACSSSGSTSADNPSAGSATNNCAGDPVKFGIITVLTGNAIAAVTPFVADGAKAAAAAVNKT